MIWITVICGMVQHYAARGVTAISMKSKGKSPRISVTLAEDERADLERMAKARDRSISWLAHRAIRFYLSEHRKDSRILKDFEGAEGG